jgi:hypothetical protein
LAAYIIQEIEQVYVELTVDPKQAAEVSPHPIPKVVIGGRHDIWNFSAPTDEAPGLRDSRSARDRKDDPGSRDILWFFTPRS